MTTAYFTSSSYESGDVAQFCWDVNPNNTAYAYTVSVTQPGQGQIDSGSGQFGTQCGSYQISSEFSGTLTMRVDVTSPSESSGSASVEVHAPQRTIDHVSAYFTDQIAYVGVPTNFCWDVSPSDVAYSFEIEQTYYAQQGVASGNAIGSQCISVTPDGNDGEFGYATLAIHVTAAGVTVSSNASIEVYFTE